MKTNHIFTPLKRSLCKATGLLAAWAVLLAAASCNDEMERIEKGEYPEPGNITLRQNKVLWIVIDGAGGTAVRQTINNGKARNLRNMMANSIYTFEGLASTDASTVVDNNKGWQAILTGTTDESNQGTSILKRMKEAKAASRSAIWASDESFYNRYAADADQALKGSNDAEVVSLAISALAANESFPDLGIVELNGVELAGREVGFYDENHQYATDEVVAAISQIDAQIAQIVKALKARPSYGMENWLLLISSNYGGLESNEGSNVYEMKDRNIFAMIWSERLSGQLLQKPLESELNYNYYTPLFSNKGMHTKASVRNAQLFNMHPDSSYTVQFMFREFYTVRNGYSYASGAHTMVSKTDNGRDGWNQGWKVLWQGNNIRMYNSTLNNSTHRVTLGNQFSGVRRDNDWHVLTMVFDRKAGHFYSYEDGVSEGRTEDKELNLNFEKYGEPVSDAPLTIGMINNSVTSGNTQFAITNLQIYDVALPAEFIANNYAQTKLEEVQNEYWNNLIGYWPADREEDLYQNVLRDYSQYAAGRNGESDMDLTGDWEASQSWSIGSIKSNHAIPVADASFYQRVINTVDLPFQTFQWLGISINEAWGWEGTARELPYQHLETTDK